MPPRLGHKKSRRGCLRCKQRRVKCDEQLPCGACVKHAVDCVLQDNLDKGQVVAPPPARRSASPLPSQHDRPTSWSPLSRAESGASIKTPGSGNENGPEATPTLAHISPPVDPLAALPIFRLAQSGFPSSSEWLTDLGLMHHYTTLTWDTLPESSLRGEVWQLAIPRLAQKHDFLMHQILAIAASHKAYLFPHEREFCLVLASQHQNRAIRGLRKVVLEITKSNCHAAFATASLLSMSALATHAKHALKDTPGPTLSDLSEYFSLLRGMHQILMSWEGVVKNGPLSDLLQLPILEASVPLLNTIVENLKTWRAPPNVNVEMKAMLEKEAWKLADWTSYLCRISVSPALRAVNTWPLNFSDQFLKLVESRNRGALEILDEYCRVLDSTGSEYWYISGWGASVRNDIAQSLHHGSAT